MIHRHDVWKYFAAALLLEHIHIYTLHMKGQRWGNPFNKNANITGVTANEAVRAVNDMPRIDARLYTEPVPAATAGHANLSAEDLLRASRALVSTDAVYNPAHPGLAIAPEAVPRYLVSAGLWYMAAAQA